MQLLIAIDICRPQGASRSARACFTIFTGWSLLKLKIALTDEYKMRFRDIRI